MDEKSQLYRATIARLEEQIEGLERGRRTLKWYLVVCGALAVPALLLHWLASLGLIIAGVSIYLVGGYLAMVHIAEDRNAIEDARAVLVELERGDERPS